MRTRLAPLIIVKQELPSDDGLYCDDINNNSTLSGNFFLNNNNNNNNDSSNNNNNDIHYNNQNHYGSLNTNFLSHIVTQPNFYQEFAGDFNNNNSQEQGGYSFIADKKCMYFDFLF
jgi:hypothetical protein